jgi:hypothetical protein
VVAGCKANYDNRIVEFVPATPVISATRTRADLNNATYVQSYTDPTGGWLATEGGNVLRGVTVAQLYPGGPYKLFVAFHHYFDSTNHYGFGYCDLDDLTGTTYKGGWRVENAPSQKASFNLSTVPWAWANANTGGRNLMSGGTDQQLMAGSVGGHSAFFWSPAVDDPVTYAPATNSTLTSVYGPDYPMSEGPNASGQQMMYPDSIVTAGWKPVSHGFMWTTDVHGGHQYVTTSDGRAGFVCPGTVGGMFSGYDLSGNPYLEADDTKSNFFPHGVWPNGTDMYWAANTGSTHGQVAGMFRCGLFFYDPDDFAAAIAGSINHYAVRAYGWKDTYADLSLNGTVGVSDGGTNLSGYNDNCVGWPNTNWNKDGTWPMFGSAYAPNKGEAGKGGLLYIISPSFYRDGDDWPMIHVYQVG